MYDILLIEGINDPGIFKAVFTAGGPGSGKSTAAKDLGLFALGLRPINSDTAFEAALKKNNTSLKLSGLDPELRDTMRVKAKVIAGKQLDLALKGRLGLVIDSTARDVSRIIKQKNDLEKLGYETAMVFVDTELETALARNKARARTVPENIVRNSHATISKNRDKLKSIFGASKFFVIHNDGDLSDLRKNTNRMFSKVKGWINKDVMNKQSKEWKAQFEALQEAKLDLAKNKKLVDTFGTTLASLVKTKYDPDNPIDSMDAAFKKIRAGRWSPKQWENIQKMATGLKGLGINLKSIKGMYMGMDKAGNTSFYEELETIFEIDRRTPAARNKSKTIANLAAFEKKLLKKMMGNPGKAIMELKVAIDTFKKLIGKSLPMLQPLFQAELDKMEGMLSQLSGLKESFAGPIPIYEEKISKSTLRKIAKMDDKALKLARKNVKAILSFTDPAQAPELFKAINKEMNRRIMAEAGEVVGAVAGKATNTASIPSGPGAVVVKPDASFAGSAVFDCDPTTFSKCLKGKKKHGRWASYLGDDSAFYNQMKAWMGQSYKNKNFVMRNKQTGEMVHARRVMGEELDEAIPKSMMYGLFDRKTGEIVVKGSKGAMSKKQKEMGGPKKFGIVNSPSAKVGDIFKSNLKMKEETVNEVFEDQPMSQKELKTFQAATKSIPKTRAMGFPNAVGNALIQKMQHMDGLNTKRFEIRLSKQKDPFKVGQVFYDIRYAENKSTSRATQSRKFVKVEDIALLKSELKRFKDTILARVVREGIDENKLNDLKRNKALQLWMNDPIYKAILQAKTPNDLKKAMATARSIRGNQGVKNFQKAVKDLM